jgi:hypothetical protein
MPRRLLVLVLSVILCAACSSYTVPGYGLSPENVLGLKKLSTKVNIGAFTAAAPGRSEIGCRGRGPVKTPDERPFEDYIRRAPIDEFKVAEVLADPAPFTLTGTLAKLDFNSMKGQWLIDMVVTSSNGRSLTLSSV